MLLVALVLGVAGILVGLSGAEVVGGVLLFLALGVLLFTRVPFAGGAGGDGA